MKRGKPKATELTGTEALRQAGFIHRRPAGTEPGTVAASAHDIIDASGNVVARLKAFEVWDWLATQQTSETTEEKA